MSALLLAGMAMSIVNQTAPLSGWEHAMSHYLDLTAAGDGRAFGQHGAQVGVATQVSAKAYEQCWAELDVSRLDQDRDEQSYRKLIEKQFARYARSEKLVTELWNDLSKKLSRWREARPARRRFIERKQCGELDDFLRTHVRKSAQIRRALQRVAAPMDFGQLDPAVSDPTAREAVMYSHLIRARFTLGDLLDNCGWLTQDSADRLLSSHE